MLHSRNFALMVPQLFAHICVRPDKLDYEMRPSAQKNLAVSFFLPKNAQKNGPA
jgi:hypothetical protein